MPTFNANTLPSQTGFDLGSPTQRWDAFLQDMDVSGNITLSSDPNFSRLNGFFNVKGPEFGAVGDGVADDTAAIQATIDAADAAIAVSVRASITGVPVVFFPTGEYRITAAIDPKRVHFMGVFPANSSRIMWDGAAGATVFTFAQSVSFRLFSGIQFIDFDNTDLPGTWFLFDGVGPDQMLVMERLQFISSSGDAIKLNAGWVNLHMHKMRWDGIGGWAINSLASSAQNNGSWSLDDFTYALNDNTLAGDPPGIFRFENPAGASFIGVAQISNARIELSGSTVQLSGNKAIVEFDGNATASSDWMSVELSNIAFGVGAGVTGTTLFHSGNSSGGNGTIPFVIENSKVSTANLITGEWNSWTLPFTSGALIHHFNFNSHPTASPFTFVGKQIEAIGFDLSAQVFQVRRRDDTGYRMRMRSDGDLNWGPGDGTTDIVLARASANNLRLGSGDGFNPQDASGMSLGLSGFRWDLQGRNVDLNGTFDVTGVSTTAVVNPLEGTLTNIHRWIFKQVDFGDMTAGSTADTFTLWTLPANTMIHDVVGTVVTTWSGGSISDAVCSVGTQAGSANDLALDDDFFTATGTKYELHDATASGGKGTLLFDATDKFAPHMFVAGGVIELQMDLTGDNHVNATAGQARIYILVSQPLGNTTTEAS